MSRLLEYVSSSAWALERGVFGRMLQVLTRHAKGVRLDDDEIAEVIAEAPSSGRKRVHRPYRVVSGVGVIPVSGVLARHAHQVNGSSQPRGTSLESIGDNFRAALADDEVQSILLDVDSPGGSVDGLVDLADELHAARGVKPTAAIADGMMASAAYWLASQTDRVYATRGSRVGSIGVLAPVLDDHRALEAEGLDVHMIASTPGKVDVTERASVGKSGLDEIEAEVQAWHDLFVDAVARGRGIDRDAAAALADGRLRLATAATAENLVDGIMSFSAAVESLQSSHRIDGPGVDSEDGMTDNYTGDNVPGTAVAGVAVETIAGGTPAFDPAALDAARAEGREAERQRIQAIGELMLPGQEAVAQSLIDDGSTVEAAAKALLADAKARDNDRLEAMRAAMSDSIGHVEIVEGVSTADETEDPTGDACRAEWDAMAKAERQEFGDFEVFRTFREGQTLGHIRVGTKHG